MVAGKAVRAVGLRLSVLDSYLGFGHEFFKLNKLSDEFCFINILSFFPVFLLKFSFSFECIAHNTQVIFL